MTGVQYVIEKLGQALAAAERENAALRQALAAKEAKDSDAANKEQD